MLSAVNKPTRNRIQESTGRKVFRVVNVIVLILLALICLLPFVNVIAISFSDSFYVDSNQVYFWPKGWTTSAYTYILTRASFWTSFRTSILRVLLGGGLNLFFIILTAYPLSKSNDKLHFRNVYTWYFFITMLVSGGMIPNYLLIAKLGLRDTLWSLVLPGALPVFNLVLMLNFFRQVPTALEEAALIDGCGRIKTFFRIVMPLAKSGLFSVFIFVFLACWNDVYTSVLYINANSKKTLTVAIYSMIGKYDINWGNVAAGTLIAMLPAILLFGFMKEIFVENIAGAVKE